MGEPIIHDLDILRPRSVFVRLAGKEIDIGFIPSGIAIDVLQLHSELQGLTDSKEKLERIESGGVEARRSFEIAAELCAAITKAQHPEMDKDWLLRNTDVVQIKALMEHVTQAVFGSLDSVEDEDLKKQPAAATNP